MVMHFQWETLSDGVWRCRLPFCDVSVGLVRGSRGSLLIDCGTTLLEAADILADVRTLAGGTVTHAVLTHHHFDHILGSAGFTDAELYAAPHVAAALTTACSMSFSAMVLKTTAGRPSHSLTSSRRRMIGMISMP